jgi:hypothetical protein
VAKVAEKLSSWPPFTNLLFCDCLHNCEKHVVFGVAGSVAGFYVWLRISFLVYLDLNILTEVDCLICRSIVSQILDDEVCLP